MAKQDEWAPCAPSAEILARFKKRLIPHAHYTKMLEDLTEALYATSRPRIITLQGPTGVGKTTLLNAVYCDGVRRALNDSQWSSGRIPMLKVVAPLDSKRQQFSWNRYFTELLLAGDERGIQSKVDPERLHRPGGFHSRSTGRETDLQSAVISMLNNRDPYAVLHDEAQHFGMVKASALKGQMEVIKYLTEMTRTTFVLFGTIELDALQALSEELGRRMLDLTFHPYEKQDADAFRDVLATIEETLALEPDTLVARWEYFLVGSVGCAGALTVWLANAYGSAIDHAEKRLTARRIEQFRLAPAKRDLMMTEIERLKVDEQKGQELEPGLWARMGLADAAEAPKSAQSGGTAEGAEGVAEIRQPRAPQTSKKRVGRRNPSRDPVGRRTDRKASTALG
jgi:AAA domain